MFSNRGNIRLSIIKGVLDRIHDAVKPRIAGPELFRHIKTKERTRNDDFKCSEPRARFSSEMRFWPRIATGRRLCKDMNQKPEARMRAQLCVKMELHS